MKKIRVAIIDDHAVVRMGLKYALALIKDFEFAGEHSDGVGAVPFIRSVQPDVILLDIRMPGRDGIGTLDDILTVCPEAKVIMLTTSGTEEDIYRSIKRGARGYVMKDRDPKDIISAVRTVAAGGRFIPDDIGETYQARLMIPDLTTREKEILTLLAHGGTNKDIARKLFVSDESVKLHLKHIFDKLEAKDRVSAVAIALRKGIVASATI